MDSPARHKTRLEAPTFRSKQGLLRRLLVIDAVESKRKLLALVARIRDLDNRRRLLGVDAVGSNNDVLVQLLGQERPQPGDDADRHWRPIESGAGDETAGSNRRDTKEPVMISRLLILLSEHLSHVECEIN